MKKLIVICGPTAVGKTGVGVRLCRDLSGELISADSQQVYRGMDIGTAKEDVAGRGVRCHLIDVVEPDEPFDAAKFVELADSAVADIASRGRVPIVVGGTGFYIRALIDGLCEAPGRDDEIRGELEAVMEGEGREALYSLLKEEDPETAQRISPRDFQRVIRALEVKRLTGRSLVEIQRQHSREKRYDALKIGLNRERGILYERINDRVDKMIENGLESEVRGIVSRYGEELASLKAVGYREFVSYLRGGMTFEESVELAKRNTRRFAKRQLTWFKADPDIEWHSPDDYSNIARRVSEFLS